VKYVNVVKTKKIRTVVVIQTTVSVQKVVLVVTAALIQIAAKPFRI